MGFFFGLATALAWGTSDFLARFASRRIGSLRALLYMQLWGLLLLTYFQIHVHSWGHLFDGSGWRPWGWGILAGVFNSLAMLAFYRCLEIGKISVVAPLSASYPALTLILSMFTGERLTAARLCGIACTMAGVLLVARGEATTKGSAADAKLARRGIVWALCASVAFGFLFWILGAHVIEATGYSATVWIIRLVGATVTFSVLRFKGLPAIQPIGVANLQTAFMGILDTGAFVLSNRGMQMEQVSVVTVLSSLYGAVTILLAAILLRERVRALQWCGIAAIFAGIILIGR
ncbi:MAG TPA: EamA family transporter [Candidatus Acidoferrum sp.]|nr:EamA family transporter [Candidatus Acidoferrum sp.]